MLPKLTHLKQKASSQLLLNAAFYFDGTTCLPMSSFLPEAKTNRFLHRQQKPIIIVGSQGYREQIKNYPIADKADLIKILKAEFGQAACWQIGSYANKQHRVQIISWLPETMALVQSACLLVPESWLFAALLPLKSCHQFTMQQATRILFKEPDGLVRTFSPKGLLASEAAIRSALGIAATMPIQTWSQTAFIQQLLQGVFNLPITALWQRKATAQKNINYQFFAIVGLGVCFIYGVTASAYLAYTAHARNQQLSAIAEEVSDKLQIQQLIDTEQQRLAALVAAKGNWDLTLHQWDLLAWFNQQKTNLANVQIEGAVMRITGETNSTTDLVAALTELPYITNVEFTAPMRRGRSGEVFSLQLSFHENLAYNAQSANLPATGGNP